MQNVETRPIAITSVSGSSSAGNCIQRCSHRRDFGSRIISATSVRCRARATVELTIGQPRAFWVSVQHDPLRNDSLPSPIFDGRWDLTTLWGSFSGKVIDGLIFNKGDNTFQVTARLRMQKRGNGDVTVIGVLGHNDFPPTFEGELIQP